MSTINRRTALLGTAAALAPAAAMASTFPPGTLNAVPNAGNDPFIRALCDFIDAETAYINAFKLPGAREADGDDVVEPYCDASFEARRRMAEAQPTTVLGLLCMINALVPMVGEPESGRPENIMNPDAHDLKGIYNDDVQEVYIRNLMEASERILVRDGEAAS